MEKTEESKKNWGPGTERAKRVFLRAFEYHQRHELFQRRKPNAQRTTKNRPAVAELPTLPTEIKPELPEVDLNGNSAKRIVHREPAEDKVNESIVADDEVERGREGLATRSVSDPVYRFPPFVSLPAVEVVALPEELSISESEESEEQIVATEEVGSVEECEAKGRRKAAPVVGETPAGWSDRDLAGQALAYVAAQETVEWELAGVPSTVGHIPSLRAQSCNWLLRQHNKLRFQEPSLFLAVEYLDKFWLEGGVVRQGEYQLLSAAALILAAKVDERYKPTCAELIFLTGQGTTQSIRDLQRMERNLLQVLDFKVLLPDPGFFLDVGLGTLRGVENEVRRELRCAGLYLIQLFLAHPNAHALQPSQIAFAALALLLNVHTGRYPKELENALGYREDDLIEIMGCIAWTLQESVRGNPDFAEASIKFSSSRFGRISKWPWMKAKMVKALAEGSSCIG